MKFPKAPVKHFSPSARTKTIQPKVKQDTNDLDRKKLESPTAEDVKAEGDTRNIAEKLKKEITEGKLEVETKNNSIIICIREEDSFCSCSAKLDKSFVPVINKIRDAIKSIDGTIRGAGHTDDNPISSSRFRSNWELSIARALSVDHALMEQGHIPESRFEIIGYGDTRPIAPNTSDENRAKNRRVVITIEQSKKM